ncbi:helix-turn-helix domain-containing protein [Streptomyces cucumeris]|uniref:helix-turn-helix domain-containing protein n=1 Tax=Streptomyces cucumeris TaxID=2962890 RepID=UPI003D731024
MRGDVHPTAGDAVAEPVRVRRLTDKERQKLKRIVRRGSTSSVRYRRAMMLLASAGGNRVPVIAQLVQTDEDTVRDVIHRFNEIGLACLTTRTSSSGRPPPAPPGSASPSPAGRSANSPPACGKCTDGTEQAKLCRRLRPHPRRHLLPRLLLRG